MQAPYTMTLKTACCTPHDSAQRAAELMRDNDCGRLPVVDAQESMRVIERASEPSSGAWAEKRVRVQRDARAIERCSDSVASARLPRRWNAVAE